MNTVIEYFKEFYHFDNDEVQENHYVLNVSKGSFEMRVILYLLNDLQTIRVSVIDIDNCDGSEHNYFFDAIELFETKRQDKIQTFLDLVIPEI